MRWILLLLCATAYAAYEAEVGQLLIPYVDDHDRALIATYKPGGVILFNFCNSLESPEEVRALTDDLQQQAASFDLPPLFICVDQEGGAMTTLPDGISPPIGNRELGAEDSLELTYSRAVEVGTRLKEMGVNFNLAPVVDVGRGARSYGDDPNLVTRHGKMATLGYQAAGILSCLKHFPGLGDVTVDSHVALPMGESSLKQIEPFREILNHSPAIMTAHVLLSDLDADDCATLSRTIITDLLRKEMGYQGLIITDSLTMGAIKEQCDDIGEAAVRAFEAGADLIIIGGRLSQRANDPIHHQELAQIQGALIEALEEGRISHERLQLSLNRIAHAKLML